MLSNTKLNKISKGIAMFLDKLRVFVKSKNTTTKHKFNKTISLSEPGIEPGTSLTRYILTTETTESIDGCQAI